MKATFSTTLLLTTASVQATGSDRADFEAFIEFNARYSKSYASLDQHNDRFEVFKSNLRKIEAHNAKPGLSFKLGINAFTDLTMEQFMGDAANRPQSSGEASKPRLEQSSAIIRND